MKQHEQRSLDALKLAKDFRDANANAGVVGALAGSAASTSSTSRSRGWRS